MGDKIRVQLWIYQRVIACQIRNTHLNHLISETVESLPALSLQCSQLKSSSPGRSRGTPHHSQLGASSSNGEWHRRAWDLVKIPFWWCFSAHMESCCFYTYYTYKHQYLVDLNLVFFHTCFLKKRYLQCSTAGSVTFHPRNSDNSPHPRVEYSLWWATKLINVGMAALR